MKWGKGITFPSFLKSKDTRILMRLPKKKKKKSEQEILFPLAGSASKCSAVGQKSPRVIIDPPSLPDSPCPRA